MQTTTRSPTMLMFSGMSAPHVLLIHVFNEAR
jgi:hypothetical protein